MSRHPFVEVTAYKAFAGTERLVLKPLTVVFGENGAGKSALVRLLKHLRSAIGADDQASPGLPLAAGGLAFGRTYLDLRNGGVADTLSVRWCTGLGELAAEIGRDPTSRVGDPKQRVLRWSCSRAGSVEPERCEIHIAPDGRLAGTGPRGATFTVSRFAGLSPVFGPDVQAGAAQRDWVLYLQPPNVHHLGAVRDPGPPDPFPPPNGIGDRWVGLNGTDTQTAFASLRHGAGAEAMALIEQQVRDLFDVELRVTDVQIGALPACYVEGRRGEDGPWLPLRDLGTGFCHALPVIVQQGIDAAGAGQALVFGSLLVTEEPEAHLRPDLQAAMADVFLAAAKGGRRSRALVETHSEPFLLRLQRRVAEDPSLRDQIGLAFVSGERGAATIQNLEIAEDGSIPGFPEGWFDAPLHEAQAIFEARRARR